MKSITKADVKGPVFGIFLMTVFTLIWGLIAETALNNRDHRILGIVCMLIILTFISFYVRFLKVLKTLPEGPQMDNDIEKKKKNRQFIIINCIQGFGIFFAKNVLLNLGLDQYFIPSFALIVGLHFFPVGMVFKQKIHYYMGIWVTTVALLGFIFTYNLSFSADYITAFVGIGGAAATITYTIRFILFTSAKLRIREEFTISQSTD